MELSAASDGSVPIVGDTVAALLSRAATLLDNGGFNVGETELHDAFLDAVLPDFSQREDRAERGALALGGYLMRMMPNRITWRDATAAGVYKLSVFCSRDWLVLQLRAAAATFRARTARVERKRLPKLRLAGTPAQIRSQLATLGDGLLVDVPTMTAAERLALADEVRAERFSLAAGGAR